MKGSDLLSLFSRHRLNGEPVSEDVKILLEHRAELMERTGIQLEPKKDWTPWLDTTYLSDTDRANPSIAANVRAISEVCDLIAFVAADEEDQYFGYWRGPTRRPVAKSPIVFYDNEGQFELCPGTNLAEAILFRHGDEDTFTELRDWFISLGIAVEAESIGDLAESGDATTPEQVHRELYARYSA